MAIGSAIERGTTLFQKAKESGAKEGLLGFTGSTVTARYGSVLYTYDESGMTIYAKAAIPQDSRIAGRTVTSIAWPRGISLI
jgi:hypothetical protein